MLTFDNFKKYTQKIDLVTEKIFEENAHADENKVFKNSNGDEQFVISEADLANFTEVEKTE